MPLTSDQERSEEIQRGRERKLPIIQVIFWIVVALVAIYACGSFVLAMFF